MFSGGTRQSSKTTVQIAGAEVLAIRRVVVRLEVASRPRVGDSRVELLRRRQRARTGSCRGGTGTSRCCGPARGRAERVADFVQDERARNLVAPARAHIVVQRDRPGDGADVGKAARLPLVRIAPDVDDDPSVSVARVSVPISSVVTASRPAELGDRARDRLSHDRQHFRLDGAAVLIDRPHVELRRSIHRNTAYGAPGRADRRCRARTGDRTGRRERRDVRRIASSVTPVRVPLCHPTHRSRLRMSGPEIDNAIRVGRRIRRRRERVAPSPPVRDRGKVPRRRDAGAADWLRADRVHELPRRRTSLPAAPAASPAALASSVSKACCRPRTPRTRSAAGRTEPNAPRQAAHESVTRQGLHPNRASGHLAIFRLLATASASTTSPQAPSAAACGHSRSRPMPLRKMPRTITRK